MQHALNAEVGIVGALKRGRWRPDLPPLGAADEVAFVSTWMRDGVKLLGGGVTQTIGAGGAVGRQVFVHLRTVDGVDHTVYPQLVARLSSLATFRTRDWQTLMVLRNRALEWGREVGVQATDLAAALASSVVLGAVVSSAEIAAVDSAGALGVSSCFREAV